MTSTREKARQRAAVRRRIAKAVALDQKENRKLRISKSVTDVRQLLQDKIFTKLISARGIDSAPTRLCNLRIRDPNVTDDRAFADDVLDFVITWKFMLPLIDDPEIIDCVDRIKPGFIPELKEVFIGLVMHGPFPNERMTQIRNGTFQS